MDTRQGVQARTLHSRVLMQAVTRLSPWHTLTRCCSCCHVCSARWRGWCAQACCWGRGRRASTTRHMATRMSLLHSVSLASVRTPYSLYDSTPSYRSGLHLPSLVLFRVLRLITA